MTRVVAAVVSTAVAIAAADVSTGRFEVIACDRAGLAAELARQGVLLRSLESHHRNLEEVFLDLTGRHLRS